MSDLDQGIFKPAVLDLPLSPSKTGPGPTTTSSIRPGCCATATEESIQAGSADEAGPYLSACPAPKHGWGCPVWNREDVRHATTKMDPQTAGPAASEPRANGVQEIRVANLGRSVVVKGELTGSEDLTVDGRVEGHIHLPDHALTIGSNATIQADVVAKVVIVFGSIVGSITVGKTVDIRRGGSVEGDLVCPRLAIQEGAHFCGKVDMGARQEAPREAEVPNAAPTPIAV